MSFISCSTANAKFQEKLQKCDGTPLPANTKVATCDDLAGLSIADATDTIKGKVALNAGTSLPGDATNCTDALTACGLNALLADTTTGGNAVINNIKALAPDATDTTKGKVALNAGTSLPGDATNCTDALTACGLNALLTDPAGNAVINNVKALVPLATTTIPGLIEEATGEETRLGATDANKDDRAVTPGSMSYALQTGKDYPIHINSSATTFSPGIFINRNSGANWHIGVYGDVIATNAIPAAQGGRFIIGSGTIGGTDSGGSVSTVDSQVVTPTGTLSTGSLGINAATGDGSKNGVGGRSVGVGGTNIGVYGLASNGAVNWAGYLDGNVAAGPITTLSDATLKEDVQAIDPAKALQFRNGLRWVSYEMFTEQQVEIVQTVTDGEGNETQVPTGRYEVKRNSLGKKRGLIAQEVQALAASIGDFSDVVQVVGEYFTLDAQGYPVKDAQGNNIVNKRLGLDYDAVSFIVMCAEQSALIPA